MSEADSLLALGALPDIIWGDEDEVELYAQVLVDGRATLFRFSRDPNDSAASLSHRIVNSFHDVDVTDQMATFGQKSDMRKAVWSTIAQVWPDCVKDTRLLKSGYVIDLTFDDMGSVLWRVDRHPLFERYLGLCARVQTTDLSPRPIPIVELSDIILIESLEGGRGCSKLVKMASSAVDSPYYVFKGVDFQSYLRFHDEDDQAALNAVETWRRSSRLVTEMTACPNIQPPPAMLVAVRNSNGDAVLIGHLSTFFQKGSLGDVVHEATEEGLRLSLQDKVKWSRQLSQAIAFAHHVKCTYHMDIKPGNCVIDDENNLLVIDWEQSGAPPNTLAPEADGTWDVHEKDHTLVYAKYTGPDRRNTQEGTGTASFHVWNVFPVWQMQCPQATERAEVFAIGRTIWMLLSRTTDDFEDVEHPDDVKVDWTGSEDTPRRWIAFVDRCMDRDPNKRPLLKDLVDFWREAASDLNGQGASATVEGV